MFTRSAVILAISLAGLSVPAKAHAQAQIHYGFGTAATSEDLAKFFSIPPDGSGLPPGSGTAAEGAKVYAGAVPFVMVTSWKATQRRGSAAIS